MKTSEIAKELGYTVAELVWFCRKQKIEIESTKAEIPPRQAALMRASLPAKKTLKNDDPALLEQIKAGGEDIKTAEGTAPKPKTVRKPPLPKTAPAAKAPTPPKPKPEAPKPAAPPKPAETHKPLTRRKVQEVKLSDIGKIKPAAPAASKAAPPAPPAKPREIPKEVEEKIKAAEEALRAHKPLLDFSQVKDDVRTVRSDAPADAPAGEEQRRAAERARRVESPARSGFGRKHPRPPRAILEAMRPRKPVRPASERDFTVTVPISLKELSQQIGIPVQMLMRKLFEHGITNMTLNSQLDKDAVEMMGLEFNRKLTVKAREVLEEQVIIVHQDKDETLTPRPPVVTILGHVDHGKTTLLDRIRKTNVAAGEAGGITQKIAAYRVKTDKGKDVVFIDTPGHQAFTNMRARGSNVTDIVVLVVSAPDGVMPQTQESINHARAAEVPVVVAINKIDKPDANVQRAKQQLAALGLNPEEWGGDTIMCELSGLTGQGVPEFLELLALQAELLDLKANAAREANGTVLEVLKSDSRGVVATLLVQGGTLRRGDVVICGGTVGRVRSLHDDRGTEIAEAGPSIPVQITGLEDLPDVGTAFSVVKDIKAARKLAEERAGDQRQRGLTGRPRVSLENIFDALGKGKIKELSVVLKADVKGSLEVLSASLQALNTQELKLKLVHAGIGTINGSDVDLAIASQAVIIGFNVDAESRAAAQAEEQEIQVRRHDVIYTLIEEVQNALEGLLEPAEVETVIGQLRIKEIFKTSKGSIAGCMVVQGKVERSARVRVLRGTQKLHTGRIASLRRFKDDVREVAEGFECGLKLEGFEGVEKDDLVEAFTIEKVPRKVYQRS